GFFATETVQPRHSYASSSDEQRSLSRPVGGRRSRETSPANGLQRLTGESMYRSFDSDFRPQSQFAGFDPKSLQTAMTRQAYDIAAPKTADLNPTLLIADSVANDASTQASLTVGGAHVFSTINTIGDLDFFRVELKAGQTYEIDM